MEEFFKSIREQRLAQKVHIANQIDFTSEVPEELRKAVENTIQKGGEGSKGGKVIGHTKSGKPIYDSHDHEGHKDYTRDDHNDAAELHGEFANNFRKKRSKSDRMSNSTNKGDDNYKKEMYHSSNVLEHKKKFLQKSEDEDIQKR